MDGFEPQLAGLCHSSAGHLGFMVDKMALGQVFFD
jgi:hypothetical protein